MALFLALAALALIASTAGSAPRVEEQHGRCDYDDCVAAADEDAEALAASTVLLQAGLRQTRSQAAEVGPIFRMRSRREVEFLSVDINSIGGPKDATDLWPLMQLVNSAMMKEESDPVWASSHELIRRYLLEQSADNEHYSRLCEQKKFEQYMAKGCSATSPGQNLRNGAPVDSYYCGSQSAGIDWKNATWKVNNLCTAESGSAYSATGVCGSLSKKQLVLNFFNTVPNWKENPLLMNVPSVDCILGLADCDIYYCQHCSKLCSSISEAGKGS